MWTSAALAAVVALCGCAGESRSAPRARVRTSRSVPRATVSASRTHTVRVADAVHRRAQARRQVRPQVRPARRPLTGRVVGVDPGHNGRNYTDPGYIDHLIWNGREHEACDTTGTETDAGYTEARFNWNVAGDLVSDLRREGARVVLTRHSNDGIGPCVTRRAQIFNRAHVSVAISIHADGGPADGRGFAVLEPVADGINSRSVPASHRFARILRDRFRAGTSMPISTYDGIDGLQPRDDLAGENLVREPYALIECGNMRNAIDARLLTSPRWQRRAAAAIAGAITRFLSGRSHGS